MSCRAAFGSFQLGVIRVTRVVSAVAGGRILNAKTAHSQIMGSVVWGIGMALHEATIIDHRSGRVMNADIAEDHVPVNADAHDIEVIFVDEPDGLVNALGIKGLGEIGIVGGAAAIAKVVHGATGKSTRDCRSRWTSCWIDPVGWRIRPERGTAAACGRRSRTARYSGMRWMPRALCVAGILRNPAFERSISATLRSCQRGMIHRPGQAVHRDRGLSARDHAADIKPVPGGGIHASEATEPP
jgi:hypothetical protein